MIETEYKGFKIQFYEDVEMWVTNGNADKSLRNIKEWIDNLIIQGTI